VRIVTLSSYLSSRAAGTRKHTAAATLER